MKTQNIVFAFCILIFAFCLGCARTVTPVVTYGDQMVVEVTLRGTMELSANRYFLVLGKDWAYKIPLPPPNIIDAAPEFIEPGMTPTLGSAEAYYSNFFSTWAGYIVLDSIGYSLVKGPFVLGQTPTREMISTVGEIGTKIYFSFRLGQMFDTVPDRIYFDFATVRWPDGAAKVPYDHLPSTDNYIVPTAGSLATIDDLADGSIDPSLDIVKCRVEIQ